MHESTSSLGTNMIIPDHLSHLIEAWDIQRISIMIVWTLIQSLLSQMKSTFHYSLVKYNIEFWEKLHIEANHAT